MDFWVPKTKFIFIRNHCLVYNANRLVSIESLSPDLHPLCLTNVAKKLQKSIKCEVKKIVGKSSL